MSQVRKSPLVVAAGEAERPTRWWLAYILTIAAIIVFGVAAGGLLSPFAGEPGSAASQVVEAIQNILIVGGLMLWVRFKEKRPVSSMGFRGSRPWRGLLIGFGIGVGLLALTALITVALGQYELVQAPGGAASGLSALPLALVLIVVVLFQAGGEEAAVRGYALPVGARQLPAVVAIFAPAIGFALLHVGATPLALLNIGMFALFVSFVVLAEGSLWVAIGVHTGWNWMQGNGLGVPVSGNARDFALAHLGQTGDATEWLSGGEFGVEASAVAAVVWAIATLFAFRYFRSRRFPDAPAEASEEPAAQ